jgi:hypothetical protein
MSKTRTHNPSPIGNVFAEVEARFFSDRRKLTMMRYECVVYMNGEAWVGTITTPLPLDAYLHEHGMILQSLASKCEAPEGSTPGHDLV